MASDQLLELQRRQLVARQRAARGLSREQQMARQGGAQISEGNRFFNGIGAGLFGGPLSQERGRALGELRGMEEGRPAAAITDQEALASALERTTDAAGAGAITGVAGGLAARGAAARPSGPAEALKPATRVSPVAKMKAEAQQLERAYRRGKGLPETLTGKGFISPEAQTLWKRASGLEKLEQIVRTSKGDAGVIRRQLDALSRNRREFGRFTEEQQAAIHKIIEGGNAGRVLEELGFFKFGAKALARTTGRAIDRRATGRGMTDLMRGME